jgi:hypothetical protein
VAVVGGAGGARSGAGGSLLVLASLMWMAMALEMSWILLESGGVEVQCLHFVTSYQHDC